MRYPLLLVPLILLGAGCAPAASRPAATPPSVERAAAPSPVSTVDPCSLITQGEAATAFGVAAQAPVRKGTACRYDTVEQTKFFDVTATAGTRATFEDMKNLCDSGTQPVSGLGATSCSANNTVVMLKGSTLVTIIAGGNFVQENLARLAASAAARIP